MQKVLRRTAQANKQGKRRAKIKAETDEIHARAQFKQEAGRINAQRADAIRGERYRRREHWELGPLSPWRNNFDRMVNKDHFGSWGVQQLNYPAKPPKDRVRDVMFREGDRVVVIEGHENVRGRVGKIKDVKEDSECLLLESTNRVCIILYLYVLASPKTDSLQVDVEAPQTEDDRVRGEAPVQTSEMPIPFRAVRLVYPLPDPSTGIPRDVILKNVVARRRYFDVYENKEVFERWLEPQHIRIPWPEKKEPNYVDEAGDTLRKQTEEETFLPTLLGPPMPMDVIDELRNRFGKHRTRHDEEYIARKEAEDAAVEVEKQRRDAILPRGARNIARRGRATAPRDREHVLPDGIAAQIGQHLASKRELSSGT